MKIRFLNISMKTTCFCIVSVFFLASPSFAKVIYFFDVDNTLIETREEYSGSFQTDIELYRVNSRQNMLQNSIGSLPDVLVVSAADLERLKKYLGKNENEPGMIGKKITLLDGRIVEPANYFLRPGMSFKNYRSANLNGKKGNNFQEDLISAMKVKPSAWKGPAWELWRTRLSNAETAQNTGTLTIRDQEDEMRETFKDLKGKAILLNEPNPKFLINLGSAKWDQFTIKHGEEDKHFGKEQFLEEFIRKLGIVELTSENTILDPDGKVSTPYHYLVFVDDNQKTLNKVAALFQKYSQAKFFNIKFGLVNTGTKTEIRESGRPVFSVVTSFGTFRPARSEEIAGTEFSNSEASQCLNALNRLVTTKGR